MRLKANQVARRRCGWWALALLVCAVPSRAQDTDATGAAAELDRKIIRAAREGSKVLANLAYLSDMIGPRVTGSAALKRANDWTAARMKDYGLANVRLEAWTIPEGWERGHAGGRILEPDNGRVLSLASYAWYPGTAGKVQGDVVYLPATTAKELEAYKGKLKNALVLVAPPAKLTPWDEIEKPGSALPGFKKKGERASEEVMAFQKARDEMLRQEGAAVLLRDAGKHFGLLFTSGGWAGKDRISATNRLPTAALAHEHYELLYRLVTRPAPAATRVEIEIANKFIPGPLAVYNTVGEIRGSSKPDEFVIVGAHLDSWDLGQGTLDNGTGSMVVLEAARILAGCGVAPKRTIRFVLFSGEEQGLHGSRAYLQLHKDELDRTSAALVHDTGTGKVLGLGWFGRPALKPILESELAILKELGVTDLHGRAGGGSDHVTFDGAGVPGCMMRQEVAGYRFGHHSQADTLTLAREPNLIQGAQVMAVTAMRLANLDKLLPREKK
jgi:carboxypeptidase Q